MELYGSLVANEGSGGGGGTADVPIKSISVNGSGVAPVNKNVNIDVPTKTSDLTNDSNFASKDDIPTKTSQLTNDSNFASTTDIPTKVSELDNDSKFVTEDELTAKGYASTSDIPTKTSQLTNDSNFASTDDIPTKTSQLENDSNFASTDAIPTKTSQLTNDSSFVTESDLTAKNYADKTYVGEQIAQSEHLKREIVDVLPEPSVADEHTIYMLKDDSVTGNDKYKEYMLIEGVVQCVGDTSVDLTDYVKTADIPTTVSELTDSTDYAKKTDLHSHDNKSVLDDITSDKVTAWDNKSDFSGSYNDLNDKPTIDAELSNTSENAIQNKVVTKEINKLYSDISFNDNDTATDGTSFTDAEDGNMIVTDCTKNLLNPTLETITKNGITCTNNGDGTYTLNGTATDNVFFDINKNIAINKGTKYKVVCFKDEDYVPNKILSCVRRVDTTDEYVFNNGSFVSDSENCWLWLTIAKDVTVSNLVAKPMLTTDLSATYDDFVPYGGYEIQSCGKNLMSVNDATNGATLDAQDSFNIRIRGLDKGNIASDRIYLLENGVMKGHQSFTFEVTIDEPYGIAIKHNGSIKDIDIEYINYMVRKGTYTISFDVASNNPSVESGLLLHNIQLEHGDTETDFEPYQSESITVTNETELPAFGLKSNKGITNIISPGNVKCVYPTNESGKGVMDSLYNKDKMLTKQKNDLGGLTFSASGTTLSITDGTHTWTLEANN